MVVLSRHVSVTSAIAGAAEGEVDDATDEEAEAKDAAFKTMTSANGNASGLQVIVIAS